MLLERKAVTNLGSILKSRDITLPTEFCIVKALVFPIVMYECESWTMMKAEHWRIDAFELWFWRILLRVPWTARISNQSILKESNSECFPGGASGKEPACQCRRHKRCGFDPWVGKIPWRRECQPTSVFLSGESQGQRSLVGYSPWSLRIGHDWSDLAYMHASSLRL